MRRFLASTPLAVFALLAGTIPASAEPTFVPIDGSHSSFSAKDFGYQIKAIATGNRCYISVELDEEAARSFTGTLLGLYQGGNLLVDTRLVLERDPSGKGLLLLAFDPRVITGGELLVHSKPIKGRPAVKNFGGFKLSVEKLLQQAYPGGSLEEIRKSAPAPDKKDPTDKLLRFLESKDPFVRAEVIDLLGERKAKEAIPKLIDLVADGASLIGSDNWVGSHAAASLSKITGRPFSTDQKEWKNWLKEQKKELEDELRREIRSLQDRLAELERRLAAERKSK